MKRYHFSIYYFKSKDREICFTEDYKTKPMLEAQFRNSVLPKWMKLAKQFANDQKLQYCLKVGNTK